MADHTYSDRAVPQRCGKRLGGLKQRGPIAGRFSRLGIDQIKLLVERRFVDPAALLRIEPEQ